ncbi:MAG: zinc ribbon domain-containing protein [Chloroflexi bacterium]|nr:zinc ribbon domain-containing protein [Chloroflexota bacterium]
MPLYEYQCAACDTRFEKLSSFAHADQDVVCPICGNTHPRRLISIFATLSPSGDRASASASGGGCACGGACSCGGH